ncbi:HNH endonuclease [Comamonas sp. w2-DMI]|uniref:HNH endonuclease n=1 Tax=Comamonas sp. w2-DMI TaxID=3126391 RepID=UPI0032E4E985
MATIFPAHAAVQPNAFSNAPSLDARSFQGLSVEHCFCPDWIHKNRWGYPIATNGKGGKSSGHRLAYRLFVGPIPNGTMVLHRCGNQGCINPHHLYLGNALQNALDRDLHGNTKAAVQLPQTKLSDEDVRAIRASSESCTALAKRYGMSRSYMWCVRTGAARNKQKAKG